MQTKIFAAVSVLAAALIGCTETLIAFLNALTDTQFINDPRFSDPFTK